MISKFLKYFWPLIIISLLCWIRIINGDKYNAITPKTMFNSVKETGSSIYGFTKGIFVKDKSNNNTNNNNDNNNNDNNFNDDDQYTDL